MPGATQPISHHTVEHTLHSMEFYKCWTTRTPLLTLWHWLLHLTWAKEYHNWVIYSDMILYMKENTWVYGCILSVQCVVHAGSSLLIVLGLFCWSLQEPLVKIKFVLICFLVIHRKHDNGFRNAQLTYRYSIDSPNKHNDGHIPGWVCSCNSSISLQTLCHVVLGLLFRWREELHVIKLLSF